MALFSRLQQLGVEKFANYEHSSNLNMCEESSARIWFARTNWRKFWYQSSSRCSSAAVPQGARAVELSQG
jgi:hypothetical protein